MSEIPYSVRGGRTSTSVAGLADTNITNLQNAEILKYDSASQKWVNAVDGGGSATISSLGDTLISNPQTNQSLVYNATVSPARWENQPTPFTQSDFTNQDNTSAAFIKNKPIITTSSSSTMVGINTGINKDGNLTAFGKGAGNAAKSDHLCIGELSGNQGSARAISLGYNTHASHSNSVVIHGGTGLSSSATNAFYIDPLRTLDALTETAGDMKINMYNTSTKEIFLTNNLLVPGKTKLNGTLEVSNGIGAVNQVLTSNNTGALTWTDKSQLSANIYDLGGLTWADVNNNELIRKTSSTTADGAGMTLHDTSSPTFPQTSYFKDVSYFGRHGQLTIPFGVNRFESTFAGYNQRIIPYSPILLSTTPVSGLYLHHLPSINDYNVRVGVNNQYPSQDFQVGTTMYVDDTNKRVGINQASPSVDLEVLNTMYVNSNTRKVGIVNATPTTTFQVGTTLYVDETTRRVGIGIPSPDENLEVDGSIQIDSANIGRLKFQQSGQTPYALAEIDGEADGSGGQLEFFTSDNGMGVSKKMVIRKDGATEIYSDGIGLSILSTDGFSQQAQIYHGSTGTQDLIIDTDAPATTTKGISFRTQAGVQRLRIGYFGELGFSPTNDIGLSGQILESRGPGNTPRWVDAPAATLPKEAFNMRFNNKLNSYPAGAHLIGGYNASTIMPGTNANTGNGRYTANREIWMNFMFVALQYNNTGGTNDMSQEIRRYNSGGTLLERVVGQTIPSHLDDQNVIQATLSMNVVMKCNANDFVIATLGSSRPFLAYSIGVDSHVVFSGHNVD